jgi:hypothetical protein
MDTSYQSYVSLLNFKCGTITTVPQHNIEGWLFVVKTTGLYDIYEKEKSTAKSQEVAMISKSQIETLVKESAFGTDTPASQKEIRRMAAEAGIYPRRIQALYEKIGRDNTPVSLCRPSTCAASAMIWHGRPSEQP